MSFFDENDIKSMGDHINSEKQKTISEVEKREQIRTAAFHALSTALTDFCDAFDEVQRLSERLRITQKLNLFRYNTDYDVNEKDEYKSTLFHPVYSDRTHYVEYQFYSDGSITKKEETLRPSGLTDKEIIRPCSTDDFRRVAEKDMIKTAEWYAKTFPSCYPTYDISRFILLTHLAFEKESIDANTIKYTSIRSTDEIHNEVKKLFEDRIIRAAKNKK